MRTILIGLLASLLLCSGCGIVGGLILLDKKSKREIMDYARCECGAWVTERKTGDGWVECGACDRWVQVQGKGSNE